MGQNEMITIPALETGTVFSGKVYPHNFYGKVGQMVWVNVSIYTDNVTYTETLVNTTAIYLDLNVATGTGAWVNLTMRSDQFEATSPERYHELFRLNHFITGRSFKINWVTSG